MKRTTGYVLLGLFLILPFWLWGQTSRQFPQDYPETTTYATGDQLLIVTTPATKPTTQKITAGNLVKRYRPCEVVIGNSNPSATVLADGDDSPATCGNVSGSDAIITAVACFADAGTPSVNPILYGGSATSILTAPLNCGNGVWAAGSVNGAPVIHSFAANGATCSVTPCSLSTNIQTAGGVARYAIVRFTLLN